MERVFALVDCNNFYVSCERVFRPDLKNKPVIVLSNNDGIIVSRSNEVKSLGIKMGEAVFKVRDLIKKHNIQVFSSNYILYADLSQRVMETLAQFAPEMEIYSIDEAFLDLTGFENLTDYCQQIKRTVEQWTGIPVSIGIGPTKTLAKAANELAKKNPEFKGVLELGNDFRAVDNLLNRLDVGDVWGIGWQYCRYLKNLGINTAFDFKQAPESLIQKKLGINGTRIILELRGISCLDLETDFSPRKGIMTSRSFSQPLKSLKELEKAVSLFASRAAEKLREQGSVASQISVFIMTNRFKKENFYFNSSSLKLNSPTAYTPELINSALKILKKIYRSNCLYKKAGVFLTGISADDKLQLNLWENNFYDSKKQGLMRTLDLINQKWGSETVKFASLEIEHDWRNTVSLNCSAGYTTQWLELPKIKC